VFTDLIDFQESKFLGIDVYKYQQSDDKFGLTSHQGFDQINFVLGAKFET
jgi:hypothetical protein